MAEVGVPVIDMQHQRVDQEIVKACEEWGCFRLLNHGVPAELLAEMKEVTAALFDLPGETTTPYTKHGMGYIKPSLINPLYEGFGMNNNSSPDNFNISNHHRETICRYTKAIRDLAGIIGRKLMEGSGLAGDLFDEGWSWEVRMNRYHFSAESVGLRCSDVHTDPSFLTILLDDENVNGLYVADKISDELIPLDHFPDSLVVNVGDISKIWSNGRYRNVKHTVLCSEPKLRHTIAFFMLGPTEKKLEAPSEFVDSDHPRLYVPIDYKEFRQVRSSRRAIYGDAPDLFKSSSK